MHKFFLPTLFVTLVLTSCLESNDGNQSPLISGGSFLVAENAAIGDSIAQVLAVDPDGDVIAFSITAGNESDKFSIDEATGELTVKNQLDDELESDYVLTVRASDGMAFTERNIQIEVLDENSERVRVSDLLIGFIWRPETVTNDDVEDETWNALELEFKGNLNGGVFTTKNSENLIVWPELDRWTFSGTTTDLLRESDGLKLTLTEITETNLTFTFSIGNQNTRELAAGDWEFVFRHNQ